jgi:DNA-binding transcriptional MerR regulator
VSDGLRSGELARAAGVHPQTLRYYERRGLLEEPGRSPGGHRLYPAGAVALIRTVKAAQRLGFTLDEVAALLDATHAGGLRSGARAKLAEVDARIAELQAVRAVLAAAIDAGCDDLEVCAATPHCPIGS